MASQLWFFTAGASHPRAPLVVWAPSSLTMAGIKQNGILGQLLRDSWLAFTEGLL